MHFIHKRKNKCKPFCPWRNLFQSLKIFKVKFRYQKLFLKSKLFQNKKNQNLNSNLRMKFKVWKSCTQEKCLLVSFWLSCFTKNVCGTFFQGNLKYYFQRHVCRACVCLSEDQLQFLQANHKMSLITVVPYVLEVTKMTSGLPHDPWGPWHS